MAAAIVDPLGQPLLGPGVALERDIVEVADGEGGDGDARLPGRFEESPAKGGVGEGQRIALGDEADLNAVEPEPCGQLEGGRVAGLADRPVADAEREVVSGLLAGCAWGSLATAAATRIAADEDSQADGRARFMDFLLPRRSVLQTLEVGDEPLAGSDDLRPRDDAVLVGRLAAEDR